MQVVKNNYLFCVTCNLVENELFSDNSDFYLFEQQLL
jgi:hypothetical protein